MAEIPALQLQVSLPDLSPTDVEMLEEVADLIGGFDAELVGRVRDLRTRVERMLVSADLRPDSGR